MSFYVPTLPRGVTSGYLVGLEQAIKYVLVGPDGTRAVFNDETDGDFVGFLTEPPGGLTDSAEIREASDVLAEMDGGVHGKFYFGRRPWTLTGFVDPGTDIVGINERIDRLRVASRAMDLDATLSWTPQGGTELMIAARRQALRITGGWPKQFSLGMVSADPRIYSSIFSESWGSAGSLAVTNRGDATTYPYITLQHTYTSPITLTNGQTGEQVRINTSLGTGDVLFIDTLARTIVKNGANAYGALDFAASDWWGLISGDQTISVTPTGGAQASWRVNWRDAWL